MTQKEKEKILEGVVKEVLYHPDRYEKEYCWVMTLDVFNELKEVFEQTDDGWKNHTLVGYPIYYSNMIPDDVWMVFIPVNNLRKILLQEHRI